MTSNTSESMADGNQLNLQILVRREMTRYLVFGSLILCAPYTFRHYELALPDPDD